MGGYAERLAWAPMMADLYQIQAWQMQDLTPSEIDRIEADIEDAVKRRGLGIGD
jgi:hypothetical protein